MRREDYGKLTLLLGVVDDTITVAEAIKEAQRRWNRLTTAEQDALIELQDARTASQQAHQAQKDLRSANKLSMQIEAKSAGMNWKAYKRQQKQRKLRQE